jgi:hypothetical protein
MKKTLLFVLALIAVGCAEPEPSPKNASAAEPEPTPRNLSDLVQQGDVLLDGETMMPYSGPVFELHPDEQGDNQPQVVASRATLKNGVPVGLAETYNKRGQTIMRFVIGDTAMSLPEGPHEVYWDLTEQERDMGWSFRSRNWNGYETMPTNTDGLQLKTTIKDGEYHGLHEYYSREGTLFWKGTYNMGERRSALSANRSDWNICAAREGFGTMPARALAG